jgi:acylphosphatase
METERVGARWLVSGRVQGVGFRWFVWRRALELGLSGWARNLTDGQVEVVAAGAPAAITGLDASLRIGPRLARVESVEKSEIPHQMIRAISFDIK